MSVWLARFFRLNRATRRGTRRPVWAELGGTRFSFSYLNSTTLGLLLTLLGLLLFWLDDANQTQTPFVVAPLHRLELLASDLRFRVRGPLTPGPEVVIAAIDEQSMSWLRVFTSANTAHLGHSGGQER
jgi:hypothetical protein